VWDNVDRGLVMSMRERVYRTVGGGLGLPSESSTFVLVRLASCSSKNALSILSFSTWRFILARRRRAASLASSTSVVRLLRRMHLRRYASSTEGGRDGGTAGSALTSAILRFGGMAREGMRIAAREERKATVD
jgi:hypothetical protein